MSHSFLILWVLVTWTVSTHTYARSHTHALTHTHLHTHGCIQKTLVQKHTHTQNYMTGRKKWKNKVVAGGKSPAWSLSAAIRHSQLVKLWKTTSTNRKRPQVSSAGGRVQQLLLDSVLPQNQKRKKSTFRLASGSWSGKVTEMFQAFMSFSFFFSSPPRFLSLWVGKLSLFASTEKQKSLGVWAQVTPTPMRPFARVRAGGAPGSSSSLLGVDRVR